MLAPQVRFNLTIMRITPLHIHQTGRRAQSTTPFRLGLIRRQAAQREMLDEAVDSQYALACQRISMARNVLLAGSIEEQRLIIRAFLRKIHFDPDTRTGTAEFWLIPGAGNEDPRRNPAGRGRRTDLSSDENYYLKPERVMIESHPIQL